MQNGSGAGKLSMLHPSQPISHREKHSFLFPERCVLRVVDEHAVFIVFSEPAPVSRLRINERMQMLLFEAFPEKRFDGLDFGFHAAAFVLPVIDSNGQVYPFGHL